MKRKLLVGLWLLACIPNVALPCRSRHQDREAELAADLQNERNQVLQLVEQADFIGIADVVESGSGAAFFLVLRPLKGSRNSPASLNWKEGITLGCSHSSGFQNILLAVGERDVIYARGDQLLRSSPVGFRKRGISYEEEEKLIQSSVDALPTGKARQQ